MVEERAHLPHSEMVEEEMVHLPLGETVEEETAHLPCSEMGVRRNGPLTPW